MTIQPDPPETPESPRRTGQQRLGGRSERVVREVTRATLAELGRVGYAALRIDDVAAQAQVNKTTVYRRWPTKADLVTATLLAMSSSDEAPPDTGSVRDDLMALIRRSVARISTCEGEAVYRMIALEMDHPEVASITRALRTEMHAPWYTTIKRAIDRGELPQGTDARLIVEMISAPVYSKKIKLREPVDDEYLAAVIDLILRGAINGGAIRAAAP
jgi:AcrR family transcriptional regulator